MKGFDIGRGLCAECRASRPARVSKKMPKEKTRATKPPPGPTSWKCPTCLKRIDVNDARTALVRHQNGRGDRCAGSGNQLPQRSTTLGLASPSSKWMPWELGCFDGLHGTHISIMPIEQHEI